MKLTKTSISMIIAGTIGLAALTAPLFADEGRSCGKRHHGQGHYSMMGGHGPMSKNPEKMIKMMSHKLDLSDEQREQAFTKLDEVRPQIRQARRDIRQGMKRLHELDSSAENFTQTLNNLANEQGKLVADMIKLRTTMHFEIEQILTEEQKTKLNELKQKRGKHNHDEDQQS